jgi:hypothetical protein
MQPNSEQRKVLNARCQRHSTLESYNFGPFAWMCS